MKTPEQCMKTPDQYLSIASVARQFDLSVWTVRDWVRDGRLPAVKVGLGLKAPVRIRTSDVEKLLHPVTPSRGRTEHGADQ